MKILRHKALALLVLCVALIQPIAMTVAYAGPLNDYLNSARSSGLFSQATGGIYQNEDSGYRAAVGGTFIFPGEAAVGVAGGFSFDFSASCMGLDFNAEAFANLKLSQIVDWLKQVLISAVFTYVIAMATASPEIKGALDTARSMGQKYSQLLQSPCELGATFGSDADKKGLKGFGNCAQEGFSKMGTASMLESYKSCIADTPNLAVDKSTKENALDICTSAFGVTAIEKTMLGALIGDSGWTRTTAGVLDIKGIKPINLVKDYQLLFDDKKTKFTVIINKIISAPPGSTGTITAADESEMSGPGMSLYAKDIRALRIISTENISNANDYIDSLSEAMALGEFKFAILKLSELLTKCQSAEELPVEVKSSMKAIVDQLMEFVAILDRGKNTARIQQQSISNGIYDAADRVISERTKNSKQRISSFGN